MLNSSQNRQSKFLVSPKYQPWLGPILLLAVWELVTITKVVPARVFPSPQAVLLAAWQLTASGELPMHFWFSLKRVLIGLLIGGGFGFLMGLFNGLWGLAFRLFDSSLQMVRNIPHLALIPFVMVWFGIGESGKIFLIDLSVFFPIYLNTLHGIRSVDPRLLEMGRSYGLSQFELVTKILIPGALPSVFVGLRYALGLMWLTLIVAETIASDNGIGYMTMNAREFFQTDVIVVGVLLYALLGIAADCLTRCLERRVLRWNPVYRHS